MRCSGVVIAVVAVAGWLVGGPARICVAAPAVPQDCNAAGGQPVRVIAVNEDWSVALDDGRSVRLAGIDPVQGTERDLALGAQARARLAAWLVDQPAVLRRTGTGLDRWGRTEGLLFAAAGSAPPTGPTSPAAPLSIALALVDAGLARGRPEAAAPAACWPAILAAETAARTGGLGLWRQPAYAILRPDDQAALASALGTMILIEGRIARIGRGKSRLFINLGENEGDMTVSLAKRDLFILDQLGLNGARLVGTWVRVRGDLEERAGFSIDVSDPAAIEVLGRPGRDDAAVRTQVTSDGMAR